MRQGNLREGNERGREVSPSAAAGEAEVVVEGCSRLPPSIDQGPSNNNVVRFKSIITSSDLVTNQRTSVLLLLPKANT